MRRDFRTLLERQWDRGRFLCVGLDPDWDRMPTGLTSTASPADGRARAEIVVDFCAAIVEATRDVAGAYKPNAAFFEAFGPDGAWAAGEVVRRIRDIAPAVPVIYDAKRGDIGSTNIGYAHDAFDRLGADAITVHPFLGGEALRPFLERSDKGVIVLCRTSNPGGGEFQDLVVGGDNATERLYEAVARRVANDWNGNNNCGVVVGATMPHELARVRSIVGEMPILIPGVGAQGGDVRETVAAGADARGRGMIINASRAILYASGGLDFADAARHEALRLSDAINAYR